MKRERTATVAALLVLFAPASCSLIVDVGELAERDGDALDADDGADVPPADADHGEEEDVHGDADSDGGVDGEAEADGDADVNGDTDAAPDCHGPYVGSGDEGTWYVADIVISRQSCYVYTCPVLSGAPELVLDGSLASISCTACDGTGISGPQCRIDSAAVDLVPISISVRCVGGPCSWSVLVTCFCSFP
jgi:hypothetical protein